MPKLNDIQNLATTDLRGWCRLEVIPKVVTSVLMKCPYKTQWPPCTDQRCILTFQRHRPNSYAHLHLLTHLPSSAGQIMKNPVLAQLSWANTGKYCTVEQAILKSSNSILSILLGWLYWHTYVCQYSFIGIHMYADILLLAYICMPI